MNPALTKLNLAKPDILVALLQTSDAITMAKQVYTRKMQIPYLAGTIFTELEEWQKAVGDAQEGWMGLSAFIAGLDRPASKEYPKIFPRLSEWAADFRKRYNMEPTSLAVASYTSMAMLLIAIDRAKTDDMEKVAAELRKLDIETISGRGHFEPTEHGTVNQAFSDMVLYQRQGGKNVILYPPDVKTGDIKPVVRQ
jgi:branched-chain amino acid transport system substrate-binding protein